MCICKCVLCMCVYYVNMCVHVYLCTCVCLYINACVWLLVIAIRTRSWNLNPIRVRCEADTQATRRPTHEIIWRSVPVRAVKTRRRFGSKTTSLHVSIYFCVIFLFTVVSEYLCFLRIILCECLIYSTNMITCIISCDVNECSIYLYSWYERLSASFHVIVGCHYWFRTSCDIQ